MQAIKGQEVEVRIISNGKLKDTLTEISDFEITNQLEVKKRSILGETSDRRDSVFNGIAGKMTLFYSNADILTLIQEIVDRAARRRRGIKINIKVALNFPDATRKVGIIEDVEFGEIPNTFSSRTDYGTIVLNFESARPVRFV